MNNFEKIKEMSIDEMAEFIQPLLNNSFCKSQKHCFDCKFNCGCVNLNKLIQYLKQEDE